MGHGQVRLVGVLVAVLYLGFACHFLLQLLRVPPHHFIGLPNLLSQGLLRLRPCSTVKFFHESKYIRHTRIQGNFQVLGEYGPQYGTTSGKFTHDPGDPRSLKIILVTHTASFAPWIRIRIARIAIQVAIHAP